MHGRGYLLAVSQAQADAFRACRSAEALDRWVTALLSVGARPRFAEVDKAWPAIHRCLGPERAGDPDLAKALPRAPSTGSAPLPVLVAPDAVSRVARALEPLDEASLRDRFYTTLEGEPDDDSAELDFLYTWHWFQRVRELYRLAVAERRSVLFTVRDDRALEAVGGAGWTHAGVRDPRRRLA